MHLSKNITKKLSFLKKRTQRGAIFGLDARLALAIFASISVVGGFVAVDVIQKTNVTALLLDLNNIKAAEQEYLLSVGASPYKFADLYENNRNIFNWSGPYTERTSDEHAKFGTFSIIKGTMTPDSPIPAPCQSKAVVCFDWVELTNVPQNMAEGLLTALSGKDSQPNTGVFRYNHSAIDDTVDIYFRMNKHQ